MWDLGAQVTDIGCLVENFAIPRCRNIQFKQPGILELDKLSIPTVSPNKVPLKITVS